MWSILVTQPKMTKLFVSQYMFDYSSIISAIEIYVRSAAFS